MPIYEYTCKECGYHFEALRQMKEADLPITCKHCLGNQATRTLSTFFAKSGDHAVAGTQQGGCGHCSGGSCASCGH